MATALTGDAHASASKSDASSMASAGAPASWMEVLREPRVEQQPGLHLYPKQQVQPRMASTQGTSDSMTPGGNAHRMSVQQNWNCPPPQESGEMRMQFVSFITQHVLGFFFSAGLISPQQVQAGLQIKPSHDKQKTWYLVRQPLLNETENIKKTEME